jgi:3',5'-cyclic AMP phosphodiesterase CpdA
MRGKRVFLHISDTHISVRDEESTPEEVSKVEDWEQKWMIRRENFARSFGEPFGEAQRIPTAEGFEKILAFTREENPDALILTGDNIEHMHPAGERYLRARLRSCGIPFLCVPGNHEDAALSGVWETGVSILDYGSFRVVGVDDRLKTVAASDLEHLETLAAESVPMIVCCHIPAAAFGNRDAMHRFGEYFSVDRETGDENGVGFVRFLEESPAVRMVLCGHIHGYSDTEIVPGKRQITASSGMIGFIHRLTVRGEI